LEIQDTDNSIVEEQLRLRGSANPASDDEELPQNDLLRIEPLRGCMCLAKSSSSRSTDQSSPEPSAEPTCGVINDSLTIALAYEHAPTVHEKDAGSVDSNVFDPPTPIALSANGSGYKGKDKSHEEYTTTSGIYDYGGPYTQLSHHRRRRLSDEESDSDEPQDNAGGGGGGDGGDGPQGADVQVQPKETKSEPSYQRTRHRRFRYKWTCVSPKTAQLSFLTIPNTLQCHCGEEKISILTEACTACSRDRCASCVTEKVTTWLSRIRL
jgi:hypothetical protein